MNQDELSGIIKDNLNQLCPEEEPLFAFYIEACNSDKDLSFLKEKNEKFKGEAFDISGTYDLIGMVISYIAFPPAAPRPIL